MISGKSARQIAAELGVSAQRRCTAGERSSKALPAGLVAGTLEALQAENRRLQKELHRAVRQRDILKNLGIISAPSDNGLHA